MPAAVAKSNILIYAASETDADMFYASGLRAPDPFIFVRTRGGRRYVVVGDLEIDRARATSTAHRCLSLTDYAQKANDRYGRRAGMSGVIASVLADLRLRSVTVPMNFPVAVADKLRTLGVRVKVARGVLFPERLIKRPPELAAIRRAMRATEAGMRAARDVLKSSRIRRGFLIYRGRRLTSETLRSVINQTVLARGYMPANTIVAGGAQACDPHERGHGPLRANRPIIVDIFPRCEQTGYYADMTRTFLRGRASSEVKAMYGAVRDGQRKALDMIHDGVRGRMVHEAIDRLFRDRGFHTGERSGRMEGFFHSTGHGLGLDIHEPPRIGRTKGVLRKGMVVTVEPGLYYHPTGGVRIEDSVLVTRSGIENLTRFSKKLEI
jgi:Xaa-Pro aminopeptidase